MYGEAARQQGSTAARQHRCLRLDRRRPDQKLAWALNYFEFWEETVAVSALGKSQTTFDLQPNGYKKASRFPFLRAIALII
jgi:hypothetical protein